MSSSNSASHIIFTAMNVYIVFNSKYFKPKASVFQTMGRDTQQAAKRLRI